MKWNGNECLIFYQITVTNPIMINKTVNNPIMINRNASKI